MMEEDASTVTVQNVLVMRHGDRVDASEPLWSLTSKRPWDPPLTDAGKIRAWTTGKKLRSAGFPVHRVIVSPFLRCLQSAYEVVAALCATVNDEALIVSMVSSQDVVIDPSCVKVHIELGLCEILCSQTIRTSMPAKDGNWFPHISQLEAIFPNGTLDHSAELIYQQLPAWEEPVNVARTRYESVITALANKFPRENLLLVTHGEAVGVSVSSFAKGLEVFEVEYCALSHLQRRINFKESRDGVVENFRVVTENAKSGVCYYSEMEQTQADTGH